MGDLGVAGGIRELVDRFAVPLEAEPAQALEDSADRLVGRALAVGVLHAQPERAPP